MLCLIIGTSCTAYNPSFYPSYDVLNPSDAVRRNPIAILSVDVTLAGDEVEYDLKLTTDLEIAPGSYFVVDEHFMQHYQELKLTIRNMR